MMNSRTWIIIIYFITAGCVAEYFPDIRENDEVIVVKGLITDQPGENTVEIYRSLSIWTSEFRNPIKKCTVWITDDLGNTDTLRKVQDGKWVTDSAEFTGIPGRSYILSFTSLEKDGMHTYESIPMKMKPVPAIDSIYYEKKEFIISHLSVEGAQIYLDTHDTDDSCRFYRWEYEETWEFRIPYPDVINRTCWGNQKSTEILIKNTSFLESDKVSGFPLKVITNPVDRLLVKYCLSVWQYSLTEDEYDYWQRLQNSVKQVGGLYDVIPASVTGNIYCRENRMEKVLGYFSVSAVKSQRRFITDNFRGMNMLYHGCVDSTVYGTDPVFVGNSWWLLIDYTDSIPPRRYYTRDRACADCTIRGRNTRPSYWN